MRVVLILSALVLATTAHAGQVYPDISNGIVASHNSGTVIYVLCSTGEVYASSGGEWAQSESHPSTWPVPLAEILDWTPRLFLARDGTVWQYEWDGDSRTHYWLSSPPLPCEGAVENEAENLDDLKSMFR